LKPPPGAGTGSVDIGNLEAQQELPAASDSRLSSGRLIRIKVCPFVAGAACNRTQRRT